jgi:hypothetical protein
MEWTPTASPDATHACNLTYASTHPQLHKRAQRYRDFFASLFGSLFETSQQERLLFSETDGLEYDDLFDMFVPMAARAVLDYVYVAEQNTAKLQDKFLVELRGHGLVFLVRWATVELLHAGRMQTSVIVFNQPSGSQLFRRHIQPVSDAVYDAASGVLTAKGDALLVRCEPYGGLDPVQDGALVRVHLQSGSILVACALAPAVFEGIQSDDPRNILVRERVQEEALGELGTTIGPQAVDATNPPRWYWSKEADDQVFLHVVRRWRWHTVRDNRNQARRMRDREALEREALERSLTSSCDDLQLVMPIGLRDSSTYEPRFPHASFLDEHGATARRVENVRLHVDADGETYMCTYRDRPGLFIRLTDSQFIITFDVLHMFVLTFVHDGATIGTRIEPVSLSSQELVQSYLRACDSHDGVALSTWFREHTGAIDDPRAFIKAPRFDANR